MNTQRGWLIRGLLSLSDPASWCLAFLVATAAFAQAPQMQWVRQFGPTEGAVYDQGSAADADGNYYVAGWTQGALPGQSSQGQADAFVRKYDSAGNILWTRQFGTSAFDRAWGVAVDAAGAAYVVGETFGGFPGYTLLGNSDCFLRKYDSSGTEVWTRQFGTSSPDTASAVATDPSGNVYVSGWTTGTLPGQASAGSQDVFIRKYDGGGNELWMGQFGTSGYELSFALATDPSGNVIIGGSTTGSFPGFSLAGAADAFLRKYDPAGAVVWTQQLGTPYHDEVRALSADPSGNLFAVGYTGGGGSLQKFDSAGAAVWTQSFSSNIYGVSADPYGGVAIAGGVGYALPGQTLIGGSDAFVRHYDSAGNLGWTRQFGTTQYDFPYAVAAGPGGLVVTGVTSGVFPGQSSNGGGDVFVRRYDFGGNELWTHQFGSLGSGTTYARAVQARSGSIYVAGDTNGAFGGQTHTASSDAYLARYDASGALVWLREFGTVGSDSAYGIAEDASGNVYVAGNTDGTFPGQTRSGVYANAFVRKYDPAGNELWTRQFAATSGGTMDTYAQAVAVDSSGALYVAGYLLGALPGQSWSGGWDIFVRKYDTSGNELLTRQLGTSTNDYAWSITIDLSGGILLGGFTQGVFPGQARAGVYVDGLVLRFDSAGTLTWASQFGMSTPGVQTRVLSVAAAPDGSIYTGGLTGGALPGQVSAGSYDAFVRKYTVSGSEVWTRQFGSNSHDQAEFVALDPSGNVAIFGMTTGVLPGQTLGGVADVFLRRYDSSGADLGLMQFGTSQNDFPGGASFGTDGSIYLAGHTQGAFPTQAKLGSVDAFLLKYITNTPPVVTANQATIVGPEGAAIANSGSYSDANAGDNVALSASFGTISKTGTNTGTWTWSWNAIDGPTPAQTVTITTNDGKGGIASVSFTVVVANVAPTVTFLVTPTLAENQTASLTGSIVDPGTVDSHAVTINWGDGASSTLSLAAGVLTFTASHTYADDNPTGTASDSYVVAVGVTDKDNGAAAASASVTVNNITPSIGPATGPVAPLPVGGQATVDAAVSDPGPLDTLLCTYSWGDDTPNTTVSPSGGSCSATHTYGAAGVYSVQITVTDDDTGASSTKFDYVVVYDPAGGFVTGGGWINSPPAAYAPNPALTGKANFGFVSKYLPGASVPSGDTQFRFQTANLDFRSRDYEWLVVAGARAQFKGTGAINGTGDYGFLLTAIDGQATGGGGIDKFRIKIWERASGVVVYDNQAGQPDSGNTATELGGGSIVVHKE